MLSKTCRRLIVGAAAALALCWPAGADVVFDDFEDGQTVNLYGGDWYTYESGYNPEINLPAFAITGGAGTMNMAGMGGSGTDREVAIGTNLKAAGMGSEWNGVQSISFKAKGPNGLKFNFYLNTLENDATPANWNKHGKQFTIAGTDWSTYTVSLTGTDLSQNSGGTAANGGAPFAFDRTKVTKFAWSVKKAENAGVTSGTFAIDDIKLIGTIQDVDPTLCQTCVLSSFGASTPSALLNDFSTSTNALGYHDGHEYANQGTDVKKGTGGRVGAGVTIDFTVGGAGDKYVGISLNLADDALTTPLDASSFTGVYFEYKTTGISKMEFAVVEKAGAQTPEGKDYHKKLPPTNGDWKAARVNFAELELPAWAQAQEPSRTLNKTQLANLQFAYKEAGAGTIAIDNIYFIGADKFPGQSVVNPPAAAKYALTYKVNTENGGWVSVAGNRRFARTDSVAAGVAGPTVTAEPNTNYRFVRWDDDNSNVSRSDIAASDKVFTAIFELQSFTITYRAGDNGDILVGSSLRKQYAVTLESGEDGPTITAVGQIDPRYQFKRWSDGRTTQSRSDKVIDRDTTFIAEFELYVAPPVIAYAKVSYTAGPGGSLIISDSRRAGPLSVVPVPAYADSLAPGDSITVTAVPDSGYAFFRWNDNITTAARVDRYADGNVDVIAVFKDTATTSVTNPALTYFDLAYSAGAGGKIKEGSGASTSQIIRSVAADSVGPTVTAVPDEGYDFVKWSDGLESAARTDIAKSDSMLTAEFVSTDTTIKTYTISYVAGPGGKLCVNNNYAAYVTSYDTVVVAGTNAVDIMAVADSGYIFVRWTDNNDSTENSRFNINVRANVSATAEFKLRSVSVASPDREIPVAPTKEISVTTVPVIVGELTAGPNPAAAVVKFFRTGRAIKTGKLSVYDASGKSVATISLSDKGGNGKRAVGTWNLKDAKGRRVADGSYAVKGAIATTDGARKKVSTIIAVTK